MLFIAITMTVTHITNRHNTAMMPGVKYQYWAQGPRFHQQGAQDRQQGAQNCQLGAQAKITVPHLKIYTLTTVAYYALATVEPPWDTRTREVVCLTQNATEVSNSASKYPVDESHGSADK